MMHDTGSMVRGSREKVGRRRHGFWAPQTSLLGFIYNHSMTRRRKKAVVSETVCYRQDKMALLLTINELQQLKVKVHCFKAFRIMHY